MSEELKNQESSHSHQKSQSSLGVPIAIVVAGLLVALAIFFTNGGTAGPNTQVTNDTNVTQETPELVVAPVTESDHILGNPNAKIVIVEYSDYDCPFCKNFHNTMNQVMAKYGESGDVTWVYRHFPIRQLHPNAESLAAASECVAELGGNEAFWKFSNLIFDERGTNEQTDMTKLPGFAQQAGVSVAEYNTCVTEGTFTNKIQDDIQAAIAAGAQGTPYSVVLVDGKQVGVINGAQQFDTVSRQIDATLAGN